MNCSDLVSCQPVSQDVSSASLLKKIKNLSIQPNWIKGEHRLWFKHETANGHQYLIADIGTKTQYPAFDHKKLTCLINRSMDKNFDAQALPICDLQFKDGNLIVELTTRSLPSIDIEGSFAKSALLDLNIERYRCDINLTQCEKLGSASTHTKSSISSPDGCKSAYINDNNVWLHLKGGSRKQVTYDGAEGYSYGAFDEAFQDIHYAVRRRTKTQLAPQYIQWSPQSRYIVAMRVDLRHTPLRPVLTEFACSQDDYMVVNQRKYPLATDQKELNRSISIIDTQTGKVIDADINSEFLQDRSPQHFNAGCLWWSQDESECYLITANTDGRGCGVVAIDCSNGQSRTIVCEKEDKHYIFNGTDVYTDIPAIAIVSSSQELLWYSQRTGYGHLYLYDIATGRLKSAITQGTWVVLQIIHIDALRRVVYFTAAGKEEGRHPHYSHLYSVSFDGGEPLLLTPEDAHHHFCTLADSGPIFSHDGEYFIDSHSTVSLAPTIVVRRRDGGFVRILNEVDGTILDTLDWMSPEIFSVKAADKVTDIYGVIYKPVHSKYNSPLPIVEYTYPGPQGSFAPKGFNQAIQSGGFVDMQMLANRGCAVVIFDGRGTSGRSREFRYGFLGTQDPFGAADHKAAIENLAQQDKQLDINRVGVMGVSYGGYAAMRAALLFPDFYKVCVSCVGAHDYRYSGNPGVRRLFGVPGKKGCDYYHDISNTHIADRLKAKLLLIYGELDHHVRLNQFFLMADALIKADKDFCSLIVPNADHSVSLLDYTKRKWQKFLLDNL